MRALIIDDAAKAKVASVLAHAEHNHWRPFSTTPSPPPGDDERFIAYLGTYRCVFSFTHDHNGSVYRQLSVSVPGTMYPHPAAVFTIASLFGFSGFDKNNPLKPGEGWSLDTTEPPQRAAVVCQMIGHDGVRQ